MSSRPSLLKSKRATPPPMLSTMYFLSGDEKLMKLMPAALVTSVKVIAAALALFLAFRGKSASDINRIRPEINDMLRFKPRFFIDWIAGFILFDLNFYDPHGALADVDCFVSNVCLAIADS